MKRKLLLTLAVLVVLAAGYVVYHPGIAFAETPLAQKSGATSMQKGNFTVDPGHTSIGFDIGHMGLSRVQGRFSKFTGALHADATDLSKSSVKITVDASSIDTAVAMRDEHLRAPDFFDVAKHAEITFASTSIRKEESEYVAVGDLTIKGVAKPVTIRFKHYGPIQDPWGNTRIGIVAEPVVIQRSDFGMTHGADAISDDVTIRVSLEATLDK
ncbi:MAG: YceI family protein [Kiritimatiellae bacterium]|nr:YceI family protein [Kiritimatiellia bacterium]